MHTYQPDQTYRCPRWEVIDLAFPLPAPPAAPYDLVFGAQWRGPDGASLRVPGFYDGQARYVLRFSPPTTGRWSFETYAGLPDLAGRRGTVDAPPAEPGQHGPAEIDPRHPQRLRYADGTPYFLLAFEADWLPLLDLPEARALERTETLAASIAASGCNHVVMNVYAYDVTWEVDPAVRPEHDFARPAAYPFGGTNLDPDFSTLNVAYFRHLDRVVRCLARHGLFAHLMIYVWNKQVAWPAMYSAADDRYFDHVVARYQAFSNVVWDIAKEALSYGRCDPPYVSERISRLRRLDAYRRLLTVHDYAYCRQHPQRVDLISIQSWRSGLYGVMRDVVSRHGDRPVLNIEHGGYERGPYTVFPGDYTDPAVCLARSYECVFAGAYSTYYWQDTSWHVVIPGPLSLSEAERPWFAAYAHMAGLFDRYDYTRLAPHPGHSSSGYCLAEGERLFLYLVPRENDALHVTLTDHVGQPARVTWFDPHTGAYVEQGEVQLRHWHTLRPPWPGQIAVLILETG
jgi:hypothetical protein